MTLAAPSSGAGGELKTKQVDQLQYLSNTHICLNMLPCSFIYLNMYKSE